MFILFLCLTFNKLKSVEFLEHSITNSENENNIIFRYNFII